MNISFSRPVGAVLVLLGFALLGGIAITLLLTSRAALVAEEEAKAGFVARPLPTGRQREPLKDNEGDGRGLAVEADSSTLAAAQIDALVRSAVAEAGGTVLSSRAEVKSEETADNHTDRIEVQAVVQGNIDALQSFLYRLESGHPLVIVDNLDMHTVDGSDGEATNASPLLNATLTMSAFWSKLRP